MIARDNLARYGVGLCSSGYYRPIEYYNIGKASEHHERKFFNEPKTFGGSHGTETAV